MRIAVSNPFGFLPAGGGGKPTPLRRQTDQTALRRTAGGEPGRETGYDHTGRPQPGSKISPSVTKTPSTIPTRQAAWS